MLFVRSTQRVLLGVSTHRNEILSLVSMFTVLTVTVTYVGKRNRWFERFKSWLLNTTGNYFASHHLLKTAFRESVLPKIHDRSRIHSHPISAAWRSSANVFAKYVASITGMGLFTFQGSNVDRKHNIRMYRSYHWSKDVQVPYSGASPKTDDLVTMVDVDYYVQMDEFLLNCDNAVLLYAFQPNKAAESTKEFCFRFYPDNSVEYKVKGGAEYKHQVWNYNVDVVTVAGWWKTKVYLVDRRAANLHHEYVLLLPIAYWNGPFAWLANWWLSHGKLEHLKPVRGDFVVIDSISDEGHLRSVAKLGNYLSATVPVEDVEALMHVATTSSQKLGNATTLSWMHGDRPCSAVLTEYVRQLVRDNPPTVFPAVEGVRTYNITKSVEEVDNDLKPLMVSYMSPLIHAAYVAADTVSNEKAAIEGRVIIPRAEAKEMAKQPSKFLLQCMDEFVEFLSETNYDCAYTSQYCADPSLCGVHPPVLLDPVDMEEVYLRQNRPSQRSLLERADAAMPVDLAKTFLKAESYQKCSDPRIITTYDTVIKREYSAYIYALTEHVQRYRWYAFGKTPAKIARIVADICVRSNVGVNCADANRMDGHVAEIVRKFELMILLKMFRKEYHGEIIALHGKQYNIKAVTDLGVKYNIEFERGSGSPETALFNTIISKFVDYFARRLSDIEPYCAFNAPGIFGGDDSLASQISQTIIGGEAVVQAGAAIGQVLENVEFKFGSRYVNFLSRYYSSLVWYGHPDSICDLPRILSKLHVTVALAGFTPLDKLAQKLTGLALSDINTPVIRDLVRTALRLGMKYVKPDKRIAGWWSQYNLVDGVPVNWPNDFPSDELFEYVEHLLPDADFEVLYKALNNCQELSGLLELPLIVTPKEPPPHPTNFVTVVTGDGNTDLLEPKEPKICRRYNEGKCKGHCKFSHVKVCKKFQSNSCNRVNCKYKHVKM